MNKLKSSVIWIGLWFFSYATPVFSQPVFSKQNIVIASTDFQQWKQQQASGFQQQEKAFLDYKDKRDKDFTAFLKSQWKEVDILKGEVRDSEPKPDIPPVMSPDSTTKQQLIKKPIVRSIEPVIDIPVDTSKPNYDTEAKTEINSGDKLVNISFYGRRIQFNFDAKLKNNLTGQIDNDVVSNYWSSLSRTNYEPLLKQLNDKKLQLQLNDWAYASLIYDVSKEINAGQRNEIALLSWFLLVKSNYKARVAYNEASIYLLVPSQHEIFEVSYFTLNKTRYYAVSFDGKKQNLGRVFTYDGEYPNTTKSFDMRVNSIVASGDQYERRRLSFDFEGQQFDVDVIYNQSRVDFFKTYPQLSLNLYFDSDVYKATATPLEKQLTTYMQGMTEQQSVNFLLRFVQTSLQYQTDIQQFGEENYLFPEETLFYPYSDCEDRAVLFAWLVKRLLGLDVVGLDYPGHVATAVQLKNNVDGDVVEYKGKRYVVADPTYINAKLGMSMPKFKQYAPKVIAY